MSVRRDSLNGCWILDKSREPWSMNDYLRCMQVDELAIEAHEKGEREFETYHTIALNANTVEIIKRSRVNNDVVVELELGKEQTIFLPENRPQISVATSDNPSHLCIQSSLQTFNGKASVTDIKILQQEDDKSVLRQQLTIVNEQTKQSSTTTRYFVPYNSPLPPKLHVVEP